MSAGSVNRCRPSPLREYAHWARTVSSLSWARPGSSMRLPSKAVSGSAAPFSTIALTSGAVRSTKPGSPGLVQPNRIVVTEPKVDSPPVRSSSTW